MIHWPRATSRPSVSSVAERPPACCRRQGYVASGVALHLSRGSPNPSLAFVGRNTWHVWPSSVDSIGSLLDCGVGGLGEVSLSEQQFPLLGVVRRDRQAVERGPHGELSHDLP